MGAAIVIGLFQGAVYGLLAVGLVLVYKATRAFNFAQGEFGTVAAFLMYVLQTQAGIPYALAFVGALVMAIALGLVVERVIVRPLMSAPRVTLLVATAGVALASIAVQLLVGGVQGRTVPPIRPGFFGLLGAAVEWQQLFVLLALVGVAVALALFFSRTNTGTAILAASQDPVATVIVGVNVARISAITWGTAAGLGALAGLLQVPVGSTGLLPGVMTTAFLIPAFTAAVIGGMTSLPGAFLGGEIVGVGQQLATYFLQGKVPGEQTLIVFAMLMLVLLIRPQGLLGVREA